MEKVEKLLLKKGVHWLGVLHKEPHIIASCVEAKYGSTCNSYLVQGVQAAAVFDIVAYRYLDGYLAELEEILGDLRKIEYIILNRTDPSHSSAIEKLLDLVPKIKVVGTAHAIRLLRRTTTTEFESITVTTGATLDLGGRTVKFYYTPFRYQQDSMFSYLVEDHILLTYDALSAHFCAQSILFSNINEQEKVHYQESLLDYYKQIFGVSKSYANRVLHYVDDLPVSMICPSHGPVIDAKPENIINFYRQWSVVASHNTKNKTIVIPYVDDSEHTEVLLSLIEEGIKAAGDDILVKKIPLNNIDYQKQKDNVLKAIEEADAVLFGSPTIHADAAQPILDLLYSMNPIKHGGKYLSAFGIYAWSSEAVGNILGRLDQLNGLVMDGLKVPFHALAKESPGAFNFGKSFADALLRSIIPPRRSKGSEDVSYEFSPIEDTSVYLWTCGVCTFRYRGEALPPNTCPACGAHHDMFIKDKFPETNYRSDKELRLVIIGNGAASITAASEARRRNEIAAITIISEEAEDTYFRAEIANKLAEGLDLKNFYVRPKAWYTEKNVRVMYNTQAVKIDSRSKEVLLAGGGSVKYDKLIIATGSSPVIPAIRDAKSKQGIFTLHRKGDMLEIREYAKECSKAIVVGSGSLGLMTAIQLKKMGLEVEMLEKSPRIFMRAVDEKGGHMLADALKKMGVKQRTSCDIKSVTGEGLKVTGVELESGQKIRGDMIVFCTGVSPNVDIVHGLPLKINRGIDVNENMRTLDGNIYACGDVAEHKGVVTGLWAAAVMQGRVAGANAVGDDIIYRDTVQPVIFNMPVIHDEYPDLDINMSVFSIGYIENVDVSRASKYTALEYHSPLAYIYHKFYFEGGMLIGAILIGDVSKAGLVFRSVITEAARNDFLHDFYR